LVKWSKKKGEGKGMSITKGYLLKQRVKRRKRGGEKKEPNGVVVETKYKTNTHLSMTLIGRGKTGLFVANSTRGNFPNSRKRGKKKKGNPAKNASPSRGKEKMSI